MFGNRLSNDELDVEIDPDGVEIIEASEEEDTAPLDGSLGRVVFEGGLNSGGRPRFFRCSSSDGSSGTGGGGRPVVRKKCR